jgi:hypothetical protein
MGRLVKKRFFFLFLEKEFQFFLDKLDLSKKLYYYFYINVNFQKILSGEKNQNE